MTQLDSEIITWLFIAFAGAAFGVLALHRVFSKKDLPGKRRSEGAPSEASPRRERISSRRESRGLPKVEVPPPPQKPEILGPGRPTLLPSALKVLRSPLLSSREPIGLTT